MKCRAPSNQRIMAHPFSSILEPLIDGVWTLTDKESPQLWTLVPTTCDVLMELFSLPSRRKSMEGGTICLDICNADSWSGIDEEGISLKRLRTKSNVATNQSHFSDTENAKGKRNERAKGTQVIDSYLGFKWNHLAIHVFLQNLRQLNAMHGRGSCLETSIAAKSVQHAELPCNFCVSSCFSWLARLEPSVVCFLATKRHKKTQKSTKNMQDDSGQGK